MTAALASDQRGGDRAEQLESLRRKMALVSEKMSGKTSAKAATQSAEVLPESEVGLVVPQWLAEALPAQVPRGSVAVLSGARSLLLGMVAAVTAAGGNAAIVGQPDIGLLAAVEMGADLSRLAVIPDPGTDPVEVAAVLIDGMDLVVLGLGGRRVPRTRARAVVARARTKGCTLLVTDGDWEGAPTRLEARICGYDFTVGGRAAHPDFTVGGRAAHPDLTAGGRAAPTPGFGRISGVRLQVSGVCAGGRPVGRVRTG
jgi:hypothetical protein